MPRKGLNVPVDYSVAAADYHDAGAIIDRSQKYRYKLWRVWDPYRPNLIWILFNPDQADGERDDMEVRRCRLFSDQLGYGGLVILCLFAWKSSHPKLLGVVPDAVGPSNDAIIEKTLKHRHACVYAWGSATAQPRFVRRRACDVDLLVRGLGVIPHALGYNQQGWPKHPRRADLDTASLGIVP